MRRTAARKRLILGLGIVGLIIFGVLYLKSRGIMIDLEMVKMYRMDIEAFLNSHLLVGVCIFMLTYVCVVGLSLPFATPLTILAGFLFGNILGTAVVSVSATIGATIALVLVRYFFYDFVRERFGNQITRVDKEFTGYGFRDVLVLRLMPIVPFALINAGAGLTRIRVRSFFFATLVGTLPFTFVYVNAGTQIANVQSSADILSLPMITGISLIVFAVAFPGFIRRHRSRRAFRSLS